MRLVCLLILCLMFIVNFSQEGSFTDERDDKTYKTVKIGDQVWMAENLAFSPDSGVFSTYRNDTAKISKYGYLYDWETAKEVCPTGWHLPSNAEWFVLTNFLGEEVAGTKMKSNTGWYNNGNGTNESGFNGFPGGYLFWGSNDHFLSLGFWWSSSNNASPNYNISIPSEKKAFAWSRKLSCCDLNIDDIPEKEKLVKGSTRKIAQLSVRCVKD